MKTSIKTLLLAAGLFLVPFAGWADTYSALDLEPCINGGVSSTGLFPSQALEDEYNAAVTRLESEPCTTGATAGPERFPTRQMEEAFRTMQREAAMSC